MGARKLGEGRMTEEEEIINADRCVPTCSMSIDITLPPSEMEVKVRNVCRALIKRWSGIHDGNFEVETVSGGITNLLLKVSVKDENREDVPVTVRVFGPNTEVVIDRKRELQATLHLSAAGFGAKLLGVFANGMVQSFIDACTLAPTDMSRPKIAAEIARQLRKFHQMEIPGPKDPQLWPDIFKLLDTASVLKFEDSAKQQKYASIAFREITDEATTLKGVADSLKAPVVFAHNDLLSGNLMLSEKEDKLYLIDFEYGSYNYRGYDIANHFNEYAGFECDYSLYPDKAAQYHFFRNYLSPDNPESFLAVEESDNFLTGLLWNCLMGKICPVIANNLLQVSNSDLQALYVETNCYALASHLFWAIWAIVQAKFSPINFDYLEYYSLRYNEYKKQKERCISIVNSFLSDTG